jgi:hypothetical protein
MFLFRIYHPLSSLLYCVMQYYTHFSYVVNLQHEVSISENYDTGVCKVLFPHAREGRDVPQLSGNGREDTGGKGDTTEMENETSGTGLTTMQK